MSFRIQHSLGGCCRRWPYIAFLRLFAHGYQSRACFLFFFYINFMRKLAKNANRFFAHQYSFLIDFSFLYICYKSDCFSPNQFKAPSNSHLQFPWKPATATHTFLLHNPLLNSLENDLFRRSGVWRSRCLQDAQSPRPQTEERSSWLHIHTKCWAVT